MQLRDEKAVVLRNIKPPITVVVTQTWNKLTDKAVSLALSISPDVSAD
jgi:hypothetical protein